ncbi:hypothetical protein VTP01DRAFT_5262 [Rhizomucor pusillus]|uniref:uncharacterized protein n=1 Tax=Rhizomucor pusillus TaxID=4840 RepID=UPI003742117C
MQQHQQFPHSSMKSENSSSPPMAVLPLNSSSKLDQEPNPFEQSFSGAAAAGIANKSDSRKEILNDKMGSQPEGSKPILPPVASITSPAPPLIAGGVLPKDVTNQFAWDSLRTGPLSPSMLQGPARPDNLDYTYRQIPQQSQQQRQQQSQQQSVNATSTTYGNQTANGVTFAHQYSSSSSPSSTTGTAGGGKFQKMENKPSQEEISGSSAARPQSRSRTQQKTTEDKPSNEEQSRKTNSRKRTATKDDGDEEYKESNSTSTKKRTRTQSKNVEDDEKRRNFLERNRIAALKCRQRKKQWLNNLQAKVEILTTENEQLQVQAEAMREEIVNLKTLLLAHKDCPVAQSNGFNAAALQKSIPSMMPQQMMASGAPAAATIPRNPPTFPQPTFVSTVDRSGAPAPSVGRQSISTAVPYTSGAPPVLSHPAHPQPASGIIGIPVQAHSAAVAAALPPPPPTQQQPMVPGSGPTSGVLRF